jgi:hypothetical protein
MKNTLTEQQRTRLLHTHFIPDHIYWWSRAIAVSENITQQQYETAVQITKSTGAQLHKHWIYQDKLILKPTSEQIRVKKQAKFASSGK